MKTIQLDNGVEATVAKIFGSSKQILVITGAGISVSSGIPVSSLHIFMEWRGL
jgi:hypothetical protein